MANDWTQMLNISYLFIFLFLAKLLKEKFVLIRSLILPSALLGGFIGMILGPDVLGILSFDQTFYENLVYHCLGIGFIALTLSEKSSRQRKDSVTSGLFILSNYCFQGVLGMVTIIGLIRLFKLDLFPGLGLILPLAYGQGPGFASNIGSTWDTTLALDYANQFGLTLATAGFLVGGLLGVLLLNVIVYRHNIPIRRLKTLENLQTKRLSITMVREVNFFDHLTMQLVWIFIIYGLTLVTIYGLSSLLENLGSIGQTIGGLIEGFNYLFGIVYAMLFKKLLAYLNKRGHRTEHLTDTYAMNNIASLAFNLMITGSVLAISLSAIKSHLLELIVLVVVGAVGTLFFVIVLGKIAFKRYPWYYILAMFGMMTGTASTGLALLRGVDPNLETDVAPNLVLGTAVAAPLGLPLMVLLALPAISYANQTTIFYYVSFFGIAFYLLLLIVILAIRRHFDKS